MPEPEFDRAYQQGMHEFETGLRELEARRSPVEWPTSGPIAAELWRRLYERLDRLEAEQARLIVALRAGAIGQWGNDGR